MLRSVLAVIVGYIVMAATVFTTFTLLYQVLGPEGSFQPGTYEASAQWIAASLLLSLLAALAGGWACAAIARHRRAVYWLVGLVVVLSIFSALPAIRGQYPGPLERKADTSQRDAMMNARQPLWVALMWPVIGAGGVLLGGRLKRVEG